MCARLRVYILNLSIYVQAENDGAVCCYATLASQHSSLPCCQPHPHGFIRKYITLMTACPVSNTTNCGACVCLCEHFISVNTLLRIGGRNVLTARIRPRTFHATKEDTPVRVYFRVRVGVFVHSDWFNLRLHHRVTKANQPPGEQSCTVNP